MPGVVWMTWGSPSLRRSLPIVTRTVFVNGSAFSSHTCSSNLSALRPAGLALSNDSSTAHSLAVSVIVRRSRVTVPIVGSSSIPAALNVGLWAVDTGYRVLVADG